MTVLGFLCSLLIGLCLGVLGSGGSILTMPVLVYLMGINPVTATSYSLFVVGLTALAGSLTFLRKNLVDLKTAVIFSAPSFLGVFLARKFLLPAIPAIITISDIYIIRKNVFIMVLFAVLMIASAFFMLRREKIKDHSGEQLTGFNYTLILAEGFIVGIITGLLGAGGGFLIIPALVILAKVPIKMAVGTSLLIIAIKSLLGFTGDIGHVTIDWKFLFVFSIFSIAGILIGGAIARKMHSEKLKPAFGWFVLAMGIYIVIKELYW